MKKIKKKLIEWLGGVALDEYRRVLEYKYIQGKYVAYERILIEMEDVYGMPADEWCKYMYSFVKNQYRTHECLVEKRKEKILQ